jgi:hypothetical protein
MVRQQTPYGPGETNREDETDAEHRATMAAEHRQRRREEPAAAAMETDGEAGLGGTEFRQMSQGNGADGGKLAYHGAPVIVPSVEGAAKPKAEHIGMRSGPLHSGAPNQPGLLPRPDYMPRRRKPAKGLLTGLLIGAAILLIITFLI